MTNSAADELFWAAYLGFEMRQGTITPDTDIAQMKADFMAGLHEEEA